MTPAESAWPTRVVDPHVHQWDPLTTPRLGSGRARLLRRVPRVPRWLGRVAPRRDREFVGDVDHVLKPYLPGDYREDAADGARVLPVGTVVHVEAEWQGLPRASVDETRWVQQLPWGVGGAPDLGAIVVHADPRRPGLAEVLDEHLAASPLVRGTRLSVAQHDDPDVRSFEQAPDVLSQAGFLDGFAAIADRGLTFELWLYSHQLPSATALVERYPQTTFVLDHYATPVGLLGPRGRRTGETAAERHALLERWRDDLSALATHPNVVAKHSGLGMPVLGGPLGPAAAWGLAEWTELAAPLVRHLHDSFGPDRTMWASNYPMDKPCLTLPATAQVVLDVLGADANRERLFHDVAARTYSIESPGDGR